MAFFFASQWRHSLSNSKSNFEDEFSFTHLICAVTQSLGAGCSEPAQCLQGLPEHWPLCCHGVTCPQDLSRCESLQCPAPTVRADHVLMRLAGAAIPEDHYLQGRVIGKSHLLHNCQRCFAPVPATSAALAFALASSISSSLQRWREGWYDLKSSWKMIEPILLMPLSHQRVHDHFYGNWKHIGGIDF